jgi:hypothetical protein
MRGRMILEWKSGGEAVDSIHLAQDSNQWRDLVNNLTDLRVR